MAKFDVELDYTGINTAMSVKTHVSVKLQNCSKVPQLHMISPELS